jgi:hypothetical protein
MKIIKDTLIFNILSPRSLSMRKMYSKIMYDNDLNIIKNIINHEIRIKIIYKIY